MAPPPPLGDSQQQRSSARSGPPGENVQVAWADLDPGEALFQGEDNSSSDTGGESQEDANELDEVVALRRRRAYIIAQLHTTGQSIRATEAEVLSGQGIPEIPKRDLAPKDTVDESNCGSFLQAVDWKAGTADGPGPKPLTDRAAERAGAVLRMFDADGDGALNFDEFRAYLVRLGRDKGKVGERLAANREFWLSFVADQAGPTNGGGGGGGTATATVSSSGNLTEAGFVGHRRMVEPEHPIELDLLALGLDVLPECLQRWLTAKDTFDRIDLEGGFVTSDGGKREDRPHGGCAGTIAREEAQLLLADNGEVMTKLRVEEELSRASCRAKVLLQLVEERRKRNRLAHSQAVSRAAAHDVEKVHRGLWLPWFLSGRTKEESITWIESSLIRAKTGLFRGLRKFSSLTGYVRRLLEALAQQGMISANLLSPLKDSDARATVRVAVGDADDEDDDGGGFSVTASYVHQGNASTEDPVEPLPPGVGLSVSLDIEAKHGTSEVALKEAAEAVDKVVRAHALPEVKRSPLFHSMRVTTAWLPDKTRVLRVALFWRTQTNIDFMCRQLKLGLRPTDFVREMSVSFFCPIELSEILESDRTVLNNRLKVSLSAEACFCGPLISRIMEETLAVMLDDVEQAAADSAEHDLGRAKRRMRTRTTAPDMEHPLVAPKRKVRGGGLAGGGPAGGGGGASSDKKAPSAAATAAATKKAGGRLQTEREKRHKEEAAMRWMDRMWAFSTRLRGLKGFTLDLEAATPLELLDSSWARAHLPASLRFHEAFTTPGYAARWFRSWKRSFLAEASSLADRARQHMERSRLRQEAADDRAAVAATTEEGRRLAGLEEELARLGVSKELLTETMGEKEEETAKRLREAKEKQTEEYLDLSDALDACVRSLLGPRELRIQSGPNMVMVEMQGLDLFEGLSPPPPGTTAAAAASAKEEVKDPTKGEGEGEGEGQRH